VTLDTDHTITAVYGQATLTLPARPTPTTPRPSV
jgi:hypothetical protein